MYRLTLLSSLALIGLMALALAALREGTDLAFRGFASLTLGILSTGLLAVLVGRRDGTWIGLSLFGWGYLFLAFSPGLGHPFRMVLVSQALFEQAVERTHNIPPAPRPLNFQFDYIGNSHQMRHVDPSGLRRWLNPNERVEVNQYEADVAAREAVAPATMAKAEAQIKISQMMATLAVAALGAVLGRYLSPRGTCPSPATSIVSSSRHGSRLLQMSIAEDAPDGHR